MVTRFLCVWVLVFCLAACSGLATAKISEGDARAPEPTAVNTPTQPDAGDTNSPSDDAAESDQELRAYVRGTTLDTNVAQAFARLFQQGLRFYLIVVSADSVGLEQTIYQDLVKRNIRATTGPDEGFDTSGLKCHPNCVFIRAHAVNEISIESWVNVLRHEQRHMVQAANNPNMARDFRDAEGTFTTYAAFAEACADEGIYVGEEIYHASERMPKLKAALGAPNAALLEKACQGDTAAYRNIVQLFETKSGGPGAFARLFPPYK